MNTSFRIVPLRLKDFSPLFSLNDTELAKHGARRVVADTQPGFPCRVSLVDADAGERLILLAFIHHDVASPYRASGPIFIRELAQEASLSPGEIPEVATTRLLSVRAYDAMGMMVNCEVAQGSDLAKQINHFLANPQISYLHLHNARAGCYSCRVERV